MHAHERHAIKFLLHHLSYGTVGGFVFGALFLFFDVAGLGTMILASRDGAMYLFLLFFGLFVTFGGLGMAVGIMNLGRERD